MPNNYYSRLRDLIPFTRARSGDIDAEFNAIEAGFGRLPADPNALARGTSTLGVESGTGNSYIVTMPNPRAMNVDGDHVAFRATHTNTDNITLNVDGIGAINFTRYDGTPFRGGEITDGFFYEARYAETENRWQLLAPDDGLIADTTSQAAAAAASAAAAQSSATAAENSASSIIGSVAAAAASASQSAGFANSSESRSIDALNSANSAASSATASANSAAAAAGSATAAAASADLILDRTMVVQKVGTDSRTGTGVPIIDPDLQLQLDSGLYLVEAFVQVRATSSGVANGGVTIEFQAPGSTAFEASGEYYGVVASNDTRRTSLAGSSLSLDLPTFDPTRYIVMKGTVRLTENDTQFGVAWRQQTLSSSNATVFGGNATAMIVTRLGD